MMSLSFSAMRPAQSPSSQARLDEDHSKAETREGGFPFRISLLATRGFRSAPSGTIESGAYKQIWEKRKRYDADCRVRCGHC